MGRINYQICPTAVTAVGRCLSDALQNDGIVLFGVIWRSVSVDAVDAHVAIEPDDGPAVQVFVLPGLIERYDGQVSVWYMFGHLGHDIVGIVFSGIDGSEVRAV